MGRFLLLLQRTGKKATTGTGLGAPFEETDKDELSVQGVWSGLKGVADLGFPGVAVNVGVRSGGAG